MRIAATLIVAFVGLGSSVSCTSAESDGTRAVDLSQLDHGNYQSTPWDPNTAKPDDTGLAIEAIRLGASLPIPYDIDPSFEFQGQTNHIPRVSPRIPETLPFVDEKEFADSTPGLIAGWKSEGHRRKSPTAGQAAYLSAFAFESSANAEMARNSFIEKQRVSDRYRPVEIPGFPTAGGNWDGMYLNSWMAHGRFTLGVRVIDHLNVTGEPKSATEFAAKAYTKIIEMMTQYTPTPEGDRAGLSIDIDGMLSRTLPGDKDSWQSGVPEGAVEPVQAALARDNSPGTTKPSLIEAGVDLISSDSYARVYRAKDADAAQRLMVDLLEPDTTYRKQVEPPRNLPSAKCFEPTDEKVPAYAKSMTCFVTIDRYLARVEALTVQNLHQRTAAQYRLLAFER
ncbi:hypothetical protein ACFU44_15500 [Nocardia rhizosphaerihabitans]|uniref:DUF7373 family lipoprotein n=1 Tax=Nocardia rhizosphaerihabitans TaxID=1691570 RepID=UPI00366FD6D3